MNDLPRHSAAAHDRRSRRRARSANAAARTEADDKAAFPSDDIAALRDAGVLALPLPIEQDPWSDDVGAAVDQLAVVLMRIGTGNLRLGASWRRTSMPVI